MIASAASRVWPTRGGTANSSIPVDMNTSTSEPSSASVPAGGLDRIARLTSISSLASGVKMTVKPSCSRRSLASSWVIPVTLGISISSPSASPPPARRNRTKRRMPRAIRSPNAVMMNGIWEEGSSSTPR